MKIIGALVFLLLIEVQITCSQNNQKIKDSYNAELAEKLGADELGMKKYVIAFLKTGPVRITDSLKRAGLMKEHLKNITRMSQERKLLIAGPFMDDGPLRGIYIFDVTSVDEAKELTATDPAIKAGTLLMELHPWYGSAALKEVPNLHKILQKKNFDD